MSKQSGDFIFIWDDLQKQHKEEISTFNEMILVIRNLFSEKFSEDTSIRLYFIDSDGDSFEIQSQREFKQVMDYFSNIASDVNQIKIKIIQQKFDISKLFFSKMNMTESNIDLNDNLMGENLLPKNKKHLLDKDNTALAGIITKELKEILTNNNLEMKKFFEEKITNYEAKIESLHKEISQLKTEKENKQSDHNCIITSRECNVFIDRVDDKVEQSQKTKSVKVSPGNKKKKHQKEENQNLFFYEADNDVYICTICFNHNAKYACVICENLYLCKECEMEDYHTVHPRLSLSSIPQFSLENISKTAYSVREPSTNIVEEKNLVYDKKFFYFEANRNFFSKCSNSLKLELSVDENFMNTNMKDNILKIKTAENIIVPLRIENLSNTQINPYEMIIIARENNPLNIGNLIIDKEVKKKSNLFLSMQIKAPSIQGDYKTNLQLIHLSKKLKCNLLSFKVIISA